MRPPFASATLLLGLAAALAGAGCLSYDEGPGRGGGEPEGATETNVAGAPCREDIECGDGGVCRPIDGEPDAGVCRPPGE